MDIVGGSAARRLGWSIGWSVVINDEI